MSATRSLRFWKPPSAAKNGTWVVPACVTSGPWPETAAFLMRSSWTSQPTTSTLTLTPVWSSNGLTVFSMSACGCGPLGMIQKLTVVPFFRALVAGLLALVVVLSLLLPPQAETTRATMTATSHEAVASFLRMFALLLRENDFGDGRSRLGPGAVRHPLARPPKGVTWLTRGRRARRAA